MKWRSVVSLVIVAAACSPGSGGPRLAKFDDLPPISSVDDNRPPDGRSTLATVPWELFVDEADPARFHVNVLDRRVVDESTAFAEERSGSEVFRERLVLTDELALMVLYSNQRNVASARVMYDGNVTLPDVPVVRAGDGWYLVVGSARGDSDFVGVHLLDADGRVVGVRAGLAESSW